HHFLLSGEKTGPSKLQKAASMGIKTIGEQDFYLLIGELSPEGTLFEPEKQPTIF
ncbi:MAG TPA: hypothetical protein DDW70_07550, partial [Rikenellaceae bacterium]|nr:hypothetical protein [Rikenellaceae bacterium]